MLVSLSILWHIEPLLAFDKFHFLNVVDHVNCHHFISVASPQEHALSNRRIRRALVIEPNLVLDRIPQIEPWV